MHSTCIIKPGLTALHAQLSKSFLHNTILPTTPRAIWGRLCKLPPPAAATRKPLLSTILTSPPVHCRTIEQKGGRICEVCSKSGDLASSAGQLLGPLASYSHNKHSRPSNLLQHTLTCPRQPRGGLFPTSKRHLEPPKAVQKRKK